MLTDIEKRVLNSLQLRGYIGNMGSMSAADRKKLLYNLVDKGYLTDQCTLTRKAINELITR